MQPQCVRCGRVLTSEILMVRCAHCIAETWKYSESDTEHLKAWPTIVKLYALKGGTDETIQG